MNTNGTVPWSRVFSQVVMSSSFRNDGAGGNYFVYIILISTSLWCVLSLCARCFLHDDGLVDLSSRWVAVGLGEQFAV